MPIPLLLEDVFDDSYVRTTCGVECLEPQTLVGRGGHLDHPGAHAGLVLIAVRHAWTGFGLAEEVLERVELARRAEPAKVVEPLIDRGAELGREGAAKRTVDPVSSNHHIRVLQYALCQILGRDLVLKVQHHAEFRATRVKQLQ